MYRSIKRDFQYLSLVTIAVAMVLLSGFWIFYDYKMLNSETERLRIKHMHDYENLLKNEVGHAIARINYEKSISKQQLKHLLKQRVEDAYTIATNLIRQNSNGSNDGLLRKLVKDSLRNIRFFDDRGYFFAINRDGTFELHPIHPELEGQNLQTGQNNLGQFVLEDALGIIDHEGEGFYNYTWSKPNTTGVSHSKLAFLKYIPELEWIIGAGEYLDDFTLDLQQQICAQIEQIRFGKDNKEYIFIATWDGISKTFPATDKNMLEARDANGVYIVKELIKKAKAGGGFVQYVMPSLNGVHSAPKLSYAAPIPEWEWYVGAGVYIDEIDSLIAENQQLFKDKVKEHLKIMGSVLLVLLLINYLIAYYISRNIWKKIELFSQFFRKASTQSISIDSEHLAYGEFQEIGKFANVMLEQRNTYLKELSVSRDEWINTFNSIGDCIIIFDAEGNVVRANSKACELHKMSPDELLHKNSSNLCSPDNPVRLTLNDKLPHSAEVSNPKLLKKFAAASFPIFSSDGKLHRTILIARDITEQKRLEEKLAQSQKMEIIGLLAGGVAHDLNNILSGIVSYPDIILAKLPEKSTLRKQILAVQRSGQQAAEIVADLLTLTRGITANKKIIDLNKLILDHLESPEIQKVLKENPLISIDTRLDRMLLSCLCSPVHIKKSLMNLIINGTEAIEGRGQITISTSNITIEKTEADLLRIANGKYIVLKIADSGTGISDTDLDRIFEPFYTKKVMGTSGSGLGLSIVWNSIKDHDGAIEVSSGSQGTEFTIYLPATEQRIEEDIDKPDLLELQGEGESVLIVDDDTQQRDIALQFLSELGYRSKAVASGEEALIYLKENKTDIIILDMILGPGMNGRETYEKIIQFSPGQKALIVSGYSKDSEVKKSQLLGAGEYVKKPYSLNQLGLALKKLQASNRPN